MRVRIVDAETGRSSFHKELQARALISLTHPNFEEVSISTVWSVPFQPEEIVLCNSTGVELQGVEVFEGDVVVFDTQRHVVALQEGTYWAIAANGDRFQLVDKDFYVDGNKWEDRNKEWRT